MEGERRSKEEGGGVKKKEGRTVSVEDDRAVGGRVVQPKGLGDKRTIPGEL
jgi:hypothetical protein